MKFSITLFIVFISSFCYSQKIIKGKVTDKTTHVPLEGAVISNIRSSANTLTDQNGNFTLKNVNNEDILTATYIGYVSEKTSPVSFGKVVNIELEKG